MRIVRMWACQHAHTSTHIQKGSPRRSAGVACTRGEKDGEEPEGQGTEHAAVHRPDPRRGAVLVAGQSPARDVGEADGDTVEIAGERIRFWDSEAPGLARAASRRRTGRHQAGSASFMLARGH